MTADLLALMWVPFSMCLVLTGIHAYLGIHVIAREVVFVDIALAQIAALGATAAFLGGYAMDTWESYAAGLSFTILGALVLALTRSRARRVSQEAVIGVVYAVSAGAAVLLADRSPHGAEHLRGMLVGSLLSVSGAEVLKVAALYAAIGAVHWLWRRPFLLISTDPAARVPRGPRRARVGLPLLRVLRLVVTSSVRIAGVLLVFSYLIVPALAGILTGGGVGPRLLVGWGFGAVVSVLAIVASAALDLPDRGHGGLRVRPGALRPRRRSEDRARVSARRSFASAARAGRVVPRGARRARRLRAEPRTHRRDEAPRGDELLSALGVLAPGGGRARRGGLAGAARRGAARLGALAAGRGAGAPRPPVRVQRGGLRAIRRPAPPGHRGTRCRRGGCHRGAGPDRRPRRRDAGAGPVDPHVWLDPVLAQAQVATIRAALERADPASAAAYADGARAFTDKLGALHEAYREGLRECARRSLVVSHGAFTYLARRYDLRQIAVTGGRPESEPSPADLAATVRAARREGARYVFVETLVSPRLAETLAREVGARILVLDPVEGLTREAAAAGRDYLSVMRENLERLRTGLECR